MPTNKSPEVAELDALAKEKSGRFYYSQCDRRYRFARNGRRPEIHTFGSTLEARPWLTALPAPVVYQGDGEVLPGAVRRERKERGVEPDRFLGYGRSFTFSGYRQ